MRYLNTLAGGYGLDTMGASAVRAIGLAHMIRSHGYQVIVMGKFHDAPASARRPEGVAIAGVTCRDIAQPNSGCRCASYVHSAEPIKQVVDEQGAGWVRAVICYNYPARGAWAIIRVARRLGIAPVLDCTGWYGREGRKILRNIWRLAGVEARMRLLTRLAGNVVFASHWFRARVARQHTVVWLFVLNTVRPGWQRGPVLDPVAPAHLIYSDSPGMGMHKDRLPIMIAVLAWLAVAGYEFRVTIAGMIVGAYLGIFPQHCDQVVVLGKRQRFLGRIPHGESLGLLRGADFLVFLRKPGHVSHIEFPPKYVDAATLGMPVISDPTSDIPFYLRDSETGLLAPDLEETSIEDVPRHAASLPPAHCTAMVACCRAENPFDMRLWQAEVRTFLENQRGGR